VEDDAMQAVDDVMETVETLRDAITAKDKTRACEAVDILLLQFVNVAGHDLRTFASTFYLLETLKSAIQAEDYDSAHDCASEFHSKLRTARETMRPNWTH
jgi:hypothetical protein